MTRFRHPIAFALTTVAVFMTLSSAAAQTTQPPRTPVPVQAQIQKSAELQRQALQNLTDRQRAEGLINNAYAELDAALSTMIIKASNAKFQDPLFEMQKKESGAGARAPAGGPRCAPQQPAGPTQGSG